MLFLVGKDIVSHLLVQKVQHVDPVVLVVEAEVADLLTKEIYFKLLVLSQLEVGVELEVRLPLLILDHVIEEVKLRIVKEVLDDLRSLFFRNFIYLVDEKN